MTEDIKRFGSDSIFLTDEETKDDNTNILAELQKDVQEQIPKGTFVLPVLQRKNVSIRYSDFIDSEIFQKWIKRCTDRRGDFDQIKFSRMVIANQARQVLHNGNEAYGNDGDPLNFAHPEFLSMLNAVDAASAIEVLFGEGPAVLATSQAILDQCGYGSRSDEDLDPIKE